MMKKTYVLLQAIGWLSFASALTSAQQAEIGFQQHTLNPGSEFSAATAIDMNQDGRLDVVSGAWWYEAPTWTPHRFREVEQIRGRFDDYSNLPLDVDGDGDLDIVSVNYRSKSIYWCRNPGPQRVDELWERVVVDTPGTSETGRLADINGDGKLDILPSGTSFAAWYEVQNGNSGRPEWVRHNLPDELIGHGVGAGDLNGDGRIDIVGPNGWAEGPLDPERDRWLWHPEFKLARDCGLPILCKDVDGDGDMDLVWARGHNIGLYWTEQLAAVETSVTDESGSDTIDKWLPRLSPSKWITHAIDTSWSNAHTLMLADINGDGVEDLVAGKRFMGHDGKDPGENDPLSVYWYEFARATKTWHSHLISFGDTCGIDLDSTCIDLDNDGDVDILAPSRCGLHWLENLRISSDLGASQRASRKVTASMRATPIYERHDQFANLLTEHGTTPLTTAIDHGFRRQQILRQMEQVMGKLPESARRIPLDLIVEQVEDAGKYMRLKLTYAAESFADSAGAPLIDRVPAYLLIPHDQAKALPAMLCLHPTQFELGKAQICGLGGQPSRFYAHELAEAGYVCLAPDYPGFADYPYDFAAHDDRYSSGTMKAIWNNIRGLDLLESLPCVDRDRIGAIGHSLGGHNALFTAAFDQRIRCVISSCGFNAFADYYQGDLKGWSSERYMPRIASDYQLNPEKMPFDFPEVLAAIAPRPIFVNAPLNDSNFAVAGVRKCEESLKPLLRLLGTEQQTIFVYPHAEHDFPESVRTQSYAWLNEHL